MKMIGQLTMLHSLDRSQTLRFQAISIAVLLFMLVILPPPTMGQGDFTDDERIAFSEINQRRVKATIAFLSSDEMAGRDTPSPELTIASRYVASRFEGAGLVGGGKDGSYFQPSKIATVTIPQTGFAISAGGKPIKQYGLLGAGREKFEYSGKIEFVGADESFSDREFETPVAMAVAEMDGPRAESKVIRRAQSLKRKGATAVLLIVDSAENRLIARANQTSRPRIINPRERLAYPTVVVGEFDKEAEYQVSIPAMQFGESEVRNVIGMIKGSDEELSKQAIIISAHLDHIGQQSGLPDPVFNGADDNATGVTGVLSLADAFGALKTKPKRTVIFMTFWGEEKGLLGAKYYAAHPLWPLDKTVANINIEMLGRPEPGAAGKAWMTGWNQSDLGPLMQAGSRQIGVDIFEHPQFSKMLYRASDNAAFVDRGVIGHSLSAGSLHKDYHQPGDEWDRLDLKHMTKVIQGLFAGSLPLAKGEVTPKKTK